MDKSLFHGLLNSILGKYIHYLTYAVSLMVLARLFTPEQFGVFTSIYVITIFFYLLCEMGLVPALIAKESIDIKMRDGVFSLTFIIGTVLSFLLFASEPIVSWYFKIDGFESIIVPISLSVVFQSLSTMPLASLQKERKFFVIARCNSISEIITLISVYYLYHVVEPIMALSMKPLLTTSLQFVLLWIASNRTRTGKAKLGKYLNQVCYLLSFSKSQLGFNLVNFFSKNLDTILVAKYLGLTSLAIYDKAYQLMRYPLMLLTYSMSPAIQPIVKEIKSDTYEFERIHNRFTRYLLYLGMLIGLFIYCMSETIVYVILGEQWLHVATLLKILSLSIPFQIVWGATAGFFQAANRADLLFKSGWISSIANVSAILLGVYIGNIESLCWCLVVSNVFSFIQGYLIFSNNILLNKLAGIIVDLKVALILNFTFLTTGSYLLLSV
ncbi:oligosaccharide flippase family protein [Vibrio breoganii]